MGDATTTRTSTAAAHGTVNEDEEAFFEEVLGQLEDAKTIWTPVDRTTYVSCLSNMGLGFMQGTLTLDPATETCSFVIDLNLRVPSDRQREAERYLRRLNSRFITRGLAISEDGWFRFELEQPLAPFRGDDINPAYRRAVITCFHHVNRLFALTCGAHAWELEDDSFMPDATSAQKGSDVTPPANSDDAEAGSSGGTDGEDDDEDLAALLARLLG